MRAKGRREAGNASKIVVAVDRVPARRYTAAKLNKFPWGPSGSLKKCQANNWNYFYLSLAS
jgi:hypothetical protein